MKKEVGVMTLDVGERLDRAILHARYVFGTSARSSFVPGIFVRPTKLFAAGDVVIADVFNGQAERVRVVGYSSKKRCFVGKPYGVAPVVQYQRWSPGARMDWKSREDIPFAAHRDRVPLSLVSSPELSTIECLSEAGARAIVLEALRVASPAALGTRG